jgi:hypothetical protein
MVAALGNGEHKAIESIRDRECIERNNVCKLDCVACEFCA